MKNLPEKIYLQIDVDGETPEDFNELHQVSWCSDKINDNDIEYIKLSSVKAREKDLLINFLTHCYKNKYIGNDLATVLLYEAEKLINK